MASREFILQGFTPRTHADAVRDLFNVRNIKRVILSVAFVSESGVHQLIDWLKPCVSKTTVFAGIRNDITSLQGLNALLPLARDLYVVDTGSRQILFHPKLYLVRGTDHARMVIGSANLTLGGLNNNIEASVVLDFDLSDEKDKSTIIMIEAELDKMAADFCENVIRINTSAELDSLLAAGRVIDETVASPPRPSGAIGLGSNPDPIPRIKLKVAPLRRALKNAKAANKLKTKISSNIGAVEPVSIPVPTVIGVQYELVWESKPLSLRDLNIPDGANTNKTGSMSLDKGLLSLDIDHRHYFREDIFGQLDWTVTNAKTTEEAYAKFHLIIKGVSYGEFDLRIGHTIGTKSKAYKQKNAMTRLSWGPVKAFVGNPDLKDRILSLYRDKAAPTRFVLEID